MERLKFLFTRQLFFPYMAHISLKLISEQRNFHGMLNFILMNVDTGIMRRSEVGKFVIIVN